jgi:hypothetical protein
MKSTETLKYLTKSKRLWWPLLPKFAGSNPAEAVGFFRAKKILSTPSFGGEVKICPMLQIFGM